MEIFFIIVSIVASVGFIYLLLKDRSKPEQKPQLDLLSQQLQHTTQTMLQQLNAVSSTLDNRLKESSRQNERVHQNVGDRLDNAAKIINQVTSRLSSMEEANKKIYEVGKDISSLQEILRAPKLRGNLGELFLGDLLSQIFPRENFSLQYKFTTGAMVDAVIHLRDQLMVPVDAKFPLENFKRVMEADGEDQETKARKLFTNDVKKHIDDIASKYILPDEGTFDFALMYVPAENVYYEVIVKDQNDKSISQHALAKRVIPVSPNSFYIYLQAILLGLRGLQIEKGAKDILATIGRLQTDFKKFGDDYALVGTHLGRAQNSFTSSEKRLSRFRDKLETIENSADTAKSLPS
jgi:DNA recombination protein RmuC